MSTFFAILRRFSTLKTKIDFSCKIKDKIFKPLGKKFRKINTRITKINGKKNIIKKIGKKLKNE